MVNAGLKTGLKALLALVSTGVAAGLGAFLFFHLVELAEGFRKSLPTLLPVFAFSAVTLPYLFSRLAGFERGGGTGFVLKKLHKSPDTLTLKESLCYYSASALTIGLGGSAGPEGPMVVLGAGFGGFFSKLAGVDKGLARIFLLSGAAAGVASAFKAPLTGILYALEIPYKRDVEGPAFLYAIPSAVTAYLVSQALLKPHILIPSHERYIPIDPYTIAISLLTGVAAAAISLVFMLTLEATGRVLRGVGWAGPVAAGAMLASLTYFLPEAGGFGYEAVNKVLENPLAITRAAAILLVTAKMIATAVTVKGGGSGGLFLPTVFIGIVTGAAFTQLLTHYGLPVEPSLVIAAMTSSMLAACNKTLVTGVILSLEVFGFMNVIPALLSSLTAYALTINWSIHENQLADRAESMAMENRLRGTG